MYEFFELDCKCKCIYYFCKKLHKMRTAIVTAFISLWLPFSKAVLAQEADSCKLYRLSTESSWIAAGHHHTYDSYLSNQLYQGVQMALGHEKMRLYKPTYDKISEYKGTSVRVGIDRNPAQNSRMLSTAIRGCYGAHYHLNCFRNLTIMPGGYTNLDLGLKYLAHNSNNPVNIIVDSNIWLSAILSYKFNIGKEPIRLTDHFSTTACGAMFSPKYTQLYYDIAYIDEYNGNIVGTSFGNRQQFRNDFSVELPIAELGTISLGMVAERLRYNVNYVKARNLDMLFKIGFVRNSYSFKGKEQIPAQFIKVLE